MKIKLNYEKRSLSLSLSIYLSLSLSFFLSLSLSTLSLSLTHTLSFTLSHSFSLSHTHTLYLSLSQEIKKREIEYNNKIKAVKCKVNSNIYYNSPALNAHPPSGIDRLYFSTCLCIILFIIFALFLL